MPEYHVYGPPGVGKTTRAVQDIEAAAQRHEPNQIMVCSFTRAAAAELAGRGLPIPTHNVGTLHSLCYRAMDRPTLAETKAAEFNLAHPQYNISSSSSGAIDDGLDAPTGSTRGDQYMAAYQLYRAKMTPRELWRESVLGFAKVWEDFKRESGYYDFTDLIEVALDQMPTAPGFPSVLFVDEAQDLNKLQFSLIRQWAEAMEFVIMYGDDDQSIYTFTGADPQNLIGHDLPDENKRVLKKSYRLPRKIHSMATTWIEQVTERQPKPYEPRSAEGEIRSLRSASWRDPRGVIELINECLDAGQTVMVLATCGFMLPNVLKELKAAGIPFHNPYRKTRGDWNPLSQSSGSMGNRLKAFLNADAMFPEWTAKQLHLWFGLLASKGLLRRGAKSEIAELAADHPGQKLSFQDWVGYFENGDPFGFNNPLSIDWLIDHAKEASRRGLQFPAEVVRKRGLDNLFKPAVTVGTVHSVKGGEADVVILFPDLSRDGMLEWRRGSTSRDSVIRTFYVGMTRARHTLVLPRPASAMAVPLKVAD